MAFFISRWVELLQEAKNLTTESDEVEIMAYRWLRGENRGVRWFKVTEM